MVPLLALAGCAQPTRPTTPAPPPPSGRVSYQAVEKKSTRHYKTDKDVSWSQPRQSSGNHAPAYPEPLLAKHLPPVTVTALLVVDPQGHVAEVRFPGQASADADMRIFEHAVRHATSQWTFTPLLRSHWKTQPDGSSLRVGDQAMPFSQSYAFRFAVRDGKPVVSSAAARRAD
jgi:hypothetical protein